MTWKSARRESKGNQIIDKHFGEGLTAGTLGSDLVKLKETSEFTGRNLGTSLVQAIARQQEEDPHYLPLTMALFRETLPKLDLYRDMPNLRAVLVRAALETAGAEGHDLGEFLPAWADAGFPERHLEALLKGESVSQPLRPMSLLSKGKVK